MKTDKNDQDTPTREEVIELALKTSVAHAYEHYSERNGPSQPTIYRWLKDEKANNEPKTSGNAPRNTQFSTLPERIEGLWQEYDELASKDKKSATELEKQAQILKLVSQLEEKLDNSDVTSAIETLDGLYEAFTAYDVTLEGEILSVSTEEVVESMRQRVEVHSKILKIMRENLKIAENSVEEARNKV